LENIVKQNITFINENLIPIQIIEETKIQLENIDPFDVPFIALTKHLNAKLWTGDKKLYNPLKTQNFQNILSTSELSVILDEFD
jgi:predicted nucleic acid-binding protein